MLAAKTVKNSNKFTFFFLHFNFFHLFLYSIELFLGPSLNFMIFRFQIVALHSFENHILKKFEKA